MILLIKSDQLGLFEKIVPVKGSVHADGKFTAPHYARRMVKPAEAKPLPLFAAPKVAKPKVATGDLFENPPPAANEPEAPKKPEPQPTPKPEPEVAEKPKAPTVEAPEPKAEPEFALTPQNVGLYDGPFDQAKAPSFGVPAGTSKDTRRRLNSDAAKLIESKSTFTGSDRAILRQYSGNGGVGDSLNEFYTDPKVAAAMWYGLRGMGLMPGAEVLEPSAATGVFIETAPPGVKVVGVEMDPTSAKIGAALHPQHVVENASLERFAVQDVRQFDAVIGNVPFGLRGSLIKDDKPELKTAEAYFLDTSIDKTKPGGIVALIVPTGVMDGKNTRGLRERLLRKAEFLGALRMPNTAFEHSHTEVTSDIVYFRKRPQDVAGALMTVKQDVLKGLGVWDDEYLSGGYFTGRGASNVLGTMVAGWRAKAGIGDDITVEGTMTAVPDSISGFRPDDVRSIQPNMGAILGALGDDEVAKAKAVTASLKHPYDNAKPGDTKVVDGVTYILQGKPPRWHRVDEFLQTPAVSDAQELAAEIERLMNGQVADRPKLEAGIRAYIEKHGNPSKNADLMLAASQDKTLYRLIGAVKPDGSLSDVVAGRESKPAESTFEAAALSLANEQGDFTPEQVAGRWHDGDAESALDHLYASTDYALNSNGSWTATDNYLSGELWPKLDAAKAALAGDKLSPADRSKFERQARLLEETIDPKSLEDVEVAINSAFLPLNVVAAYFNEMRQSSDNRYGPKEPLKIGFDRGIYKIENSSYDTSLLEKYLNRTGVKKDDLPALEQMNQEFKIWLCSSKFRDEIEDLYNRRFRGFRQRGYSNSPIAVPGLTTEMAPNAYHWEGLRWALDAGKGIVAADVGLGKTPRGLILAKLLKETGRAKKPMIVVPKSVLCNWVAEAEKWFPGSTVMTIGETYSTDKAGNLKGRQDTAEERNRKLHDLTQNEYDFIFISQPSWNDLDVDPITKGDFANDDFWVQRGDALGNAGDKRINKIREAHKQALAQREFQKRTDAIYFNDLGVDAIIGDEFHAFKNLYAARNRFGQSPKFLGGQGLSNRALDMNFKSRWVREHNGGNNVYGLTATPTKNSPLEIYSMLSHIAPEAFVNIGVRNSEEFLDRFVEFKNESILNTRGEIEDALVTTGFKNLDELREIMRRYIDRKTAADVGLVLPGRDDRLHTVDMSAEQKAVYAELRILAEESAGKKDATGEMHIFSIMDKMGKAAMDLELYDPATYAGADSPKYEAAAKEIAAGAKDGGQVVFAENIKVHQKMVDKLVANGIPRERIAIVNAGVAPTSAQRQNIADALNAGKLDVVIGNMTMSEGMNMQKNTTDIHHMDLPWDPSSVQQRNGRGLRQGNKMESVRIHTYLAKGSFDGYRYQTIMAKKDWQDLLWNGGDRVENLSREGNVSRDDMMIMLAADPDAARAKYAENKSAAKLRFDEQQRGMAAGQFSRLQEMKVSFSSIKRKDTASANRLRIKIERMKTNLADNPNFNAKHALDSDKPVLVQPHTGEVFEAGSAFEITDAPDSPSVDTGKYVVTAVDVRSGMVGARLYGSTGIPRIFKLDALKAGVKPFKYDEGEEKAEISRALASDAAGKVGEVKSMKELASLPHSVIKDSYAKLQTRIKAGMKDYSFHHEYGDVGLLDPAGNAIAAPSYDAHNLIDTHDVMLPTPEHREKAKAAYIDDARNRQFTHDYQQSRRGGGKTTSRFVAKYPGSHSGSTHNRWESIGKHLFGSDFKIEAHSEFQRGQHEKARRAKTFDEAMTHVAPAIEMGYTGVKWPKRGLAVLWAAAKRDGKLDEPMDRAMPKKVSYGASVPVLPKELFARKKYHQVEGISTSLPVRDVLIELATGAGHNDLAAAMVVSGAKDPRAAVMNLMNMPREDKAVVAGLRHMADRHPELGRTTMREFGFNIADVGRSTTLDDYVDTLGSGDEEGGDDERDAA